MPSPKAPFESWPVQHYDPRYGFAWYCGAGVIVSHVVIAHGSDAVAHAYHDFEGSVLHERAVEIAAAGGLFVIHDWRALVSYDANARRVWQDRMKSRKKSYLRGSVVCVEKASPLLKMAVQAANVVASVLHGAKVELTTDLRGALATYVPTPPRGASLAPSR